MYQAPDCMLYVRVVGLSRSKICVNQVNQFQPIVVYSNRFELFQPGMCQHVCVRA